MQKKQQRWIALVATIAAIGGSAIAAAYAMRRLFGRGYEEEPLGEPVVYPARGAGSGFPEPTSPEHTEVYVPPAPAHDAAQPAENSTGERLRTVPLTETPVPLSAEDTDPAAAAFTAVPSEPAQRPPTVLSEQQAEMSAWMQTHQQQLYDAFPGLTPRDIVESEGVLDRLAAIAAERAGMTLDEAWARIKELLAAPPDDEVREEREA